MAVSNPSPGGVQIGSKRHSARPGYVTNDLAELSPLKHKLSEAEEKGLITQTPGARLRTRTTITTTKPLQPMTLIAHEVAHVSVDDAPVMEAPVDNQQEAQETEAQKEAKRQRGRRSNAELGLETPEYALKLARRAQKEGITVDELREQLREARRTKGKAKKGELTPAEAVAKAVPTLVATEPEAPKKIKEPRISLQSLLPGFGTTDAAPSQEVASEATEVDKSIKEVERHVTTDYDQFTFKETNRKVTQGGVEAMIKTIKAHNKLHLNPIHVDTQMRVVNGQHRYLAAKALGLPLYYYIEDATDQEMLAISGTQKSLTLRDYLDSYVMQGKAEYIKVRDFIDKHKVVLGSAISLLSGRNTIPNSELMDMFKAGTFKVRSIEHAERLLAIREVVHEVGKDFYGSRSFTNAIAKIASLPNFDEDRMTEKIKARGHGELHQAPTTELYVGQLLNLYNKNLPKQNHLKLA
jgi:ParB-like chromosome segregation protein Spo0J